MNDRSLRELMALPLTLRAGVLARALWSGMQATRRRGHGGTFRELREYRPGDPLRSVDWRASARNERWLVREVDRMTQLRVGLLVDRSESMRYGDAETRKADNAVTLAAAVALHALRQGHAVSLWDERQAPPARTGRAAAARILAALTENAEREFSLPPLDQAPGRFDLILVLGDFLDADSEDAFRRLGMLATRGCEVRLLQILHPDEVDFPFRQPSVFVPLDARERIDLQLHPREVRAAYLDNLQSHLRACDRAARRYRLDFERHLSHRRPLAAATFLTTGHSA